MSDFRSFNFGGELPSQAQIMSSWISVADAIQVSVVVTAYNHAGYIDDCLRGILTQKTSFPFEVIVHDDVSDDGTSEIIFSYLYRYPELIKFICQKENQYSKGCNLPLLNSFDFCVGNYIAICEGDDFWVDGNKLQLQHDMLECNPGCSIVVHNAYVIEEGRRMREFKIVDRDFEFRESNILDDLGQFSPTASYFFKKDVLDVLPSWFCSAPVGDLLIELYSQKIGFGLYLEGKYSVYRYMSFGSWSSTTARNRIERFSVIENLIDLQKKLYMDFPLSADEIDLRIEKSYSALSFQLSRLNIFEMFKSENRVKYSKIRAQAKELKCSGLINFAFKFPSFYPFFVIIYVFRIALNGVVNRFRLFKRVIY